MSAVENYLKENYEHDIDKILLADGFENAFMGVIESFGQKPRACYNSQKCLELLIKRDNMTLEDAIEYMNFNVTQAYVGEYTPAFMFPFDGEWDSVDF